MTFSIFSALAAIALIAAESPIAAQKPVLLTTDFAGADYSIRANACLGALSTAGGGTCDSRGEPTSNAASESVTVGDGTHHIELILPVGTITFASGKQLIYRAHSSITGKGYEEIGSKVLCSKPNTVNCVQSYNEPTYTLYGAHLTNFYIATNATSTEVTGGSAGLAVGGPGNADVLESRFELLKIDSGYFDTGTLVGGAYGCTCYNTFDQVFSNGWSYSVYLANFSHYAGDTNSNTWIGGTQMGHSVGIYVSGGKNTFFHPDIEGAQTHSMDIEGYGNSVIAPYFEADGCLILGGLDQYVEGPLSYGGGTFQTCYAAGTMIDAKPRVAGTGYLVGDVVTFIGSGSSGTATGKVAAVNESGGVTSITVAPGGTRYKPTYNYLGTGGSGKGLKATATVESSNSLIWGPDSAPTSIGVANGVYLGARDQNSGQSLLQANANPGTVDLNCSGTTVTTYGRNGHCPLAVGELTTSSGQANKGRQTLTRLSYSTAPTAVPTPEGLTTYTYYVVGYDRNGGETVPSTGTTITNGPATLGAIQTVVPAAKGSGYMVGDIAKIFGNGSDGTATAAVKTVNATGGVLSLTVATPGRKYAAIAGGGGKNIFATGGGRGTGLTVTITSSNILVTPPVIDGLWCVDVLTADTSHLLPSSPGSAAGCALVSSLPGRYDYGQDVVAFTPVSRNTTADVSSAGNVGVGRECPAGTPSGTVCAAGVMLTPVPISAFPKAGPANTGELQIANNGVSPTDCTIGGGGMQVTCASNGRSYVPLAAGGGLADKAISNQLKADCSISGSVIFSEPQQSTSYKKVVIYLDRCVGTVNYTYPTAFTYTPQLLSQSLTTREFPSISSTSLTVKGDNSTGFVDLDGF